MTVGDFEIKIRHEIDKLSLNDFFTQTEHINPE